MSGWKFTLPIDEVSGALHAALAANTRAVLVAPPGAGKTTRVPLEMLRQPWVANRKIIVLEPRRIAARAAALRMAQTLDEEVGATVGLRVRLQSRVGPATRIEIVTEGVFARMILDDPSLDGVAAVVFDEFHERSLDADMGLALALDAQAGLREDLRLLVMSATLDGARVAAQLGDAPVIRSEGRAYPVVTHYIGRDPRARIEDEVVRAVLQALRAEPGSLLVFLPGQGEIVRVAERLRESISDAAVDIAPLFGAMDGRAQDLAVEAAAAGRRKIVLATSIAETSLTIEGVRVVVDSGLARVPRFEPEIGLTRLETVRVSRAAADQRRGRAGRTGPGVCYRLWEEAATGALQPYATPEILAADLSSMMLDLAEWGARDPASLRWLDPPPQAAVNEARALLRALGALDEEGAITASGRAVRSLALPPRLARMVIEAARAGEADLAADIAAVLVERGLAGESVDIAPRVERLARDRSTRAQDARRLARGWADKARALSDSAPRADYDTERTGAWVAIAFPDRIAKARGKPGAFVMANGRGASCEAHDALAKSRYLAIAEVSGKAGAARILAAAPLTLQDIETVAGQTVETADETVFDRADAILRMRRVRRLGAIVLGEQPRPVAGADAARALAIGVVALGIERLPWSKAQKQWRDRVLFLRRAEGDLWPDLSDAGLAEDPGSWLAPFIEGRSALADISPDDLEAALKALVPWELARKLDAQAPTHFEAPTGSRIPLDYEVEGGPVLAIRVQELFGLSQHPSLADGRVPLTLHLLSPAHRPIQITRDLPGFWKGSWSAVKSEMKGRYPRHVWPEDPASATATARAKPRGT